MNSKYKMAVMSLLALVLMVSLCLGCGGDKDGGRATITIGEITDLTGPGSPAIIPIHYVLEDLVHYYNDEGLIPGVKLDLVTYDERWDPSRDVTGYYWLREHGAELIVSLPPHTSLTLKPFAEREKVAVASLTGLEAVQEPPGWVFCFSSPTSWGYAVVTKWVSENHWDYDQGIPKIGFVGWSETNAIEIEKAIKDYCQDHPDKFDYVGGYFGPVGTMTWGSEADKLKDCDYVAAHANPMGPVVNLFRARGYPATFIDSGTAINYLKLWVDMCGWEALDGTLSANVTPWWNEPFPVVDLCKELLQRYRPAEAEDVMHTGQAYIGVCSETIAIFDILQAAVEEVGADNFDGQAFYDAAVEYKTSGHLWEGYLESGFTQTRRYLLDHYLIYEWDAEREDLVRVGDWQPLVTE